MADRRSLALALVAVLVVAGLGLAAVQFGLLDDRDATTVTVVDEDGSELATIEVAVADSFRERYVGLSNHESLAVGHGMLFVHPSTGSHTYVMRDMDFGLDIVFVAADGTITRIHHAPEPPPGTDGADMRYAGQGKYVLEVPLGYTNETGIEVGDRVKIPAEHRKAEGE